MSGPVQPPLNVQEDDGSNEVLPTHKMSFDATNFTVAKNGTTARILFIGGGGAGTIGGSITEGQVAFGAATADEIEGSANFTFDGDRTLKFQGATPRLYLGDTDVSTAENEMLLIMKSGSASFIYDRQDAGSLNLGAGDTSSHIIIKPDGEIIINEGGNAEADVRMESDAYGNMFYLDAGFNKIFMGNGAVSNDADLGIVQISVGNSLQTALSLISTEGDALGAPTLNFYRNSSSPDVQDAVGRIEFKGNDSDVVKAEYASIAVYIQDETAGSQDGDMRFEILKGNSTKEYLRMNSFGVVFNELSADQDFKVESNGNANMLTINGGTDTIGIAGVSQTDATLTIYDTNDQDVLLRLETDENSADKSPALEFYKNSAGDINDFIMSIDSFGFNSTPSKFQYSRIATYIEDETAGTENGVIILEVGEAGSLARNLVVGSSLVTINASSRNVDFKIMNDAGTVNLYSDAGIEAVAIKNVPTTGLADNNPVLQVEGSITGKMPVIVANADLTLARTGMSGQTYVCTDGGTTALTMPLGALQGDYCYFVSSNGGIQIVVDIASQTLNGATVPITRSTDNEIYTVLCITDDKFILSNPA